MWELDCEESWAPKNWCFWTVVWRRLLRVPWTARRSNQSILKEISPECSLEGRMLKLKLSILLPHDAKSWLTGKDPDAGSLRAGGEGDDSGWDGWMALPTQWTWVWVNSGSQWWTERPSVLRFMGLQSRTWLSNWTDWLTDFSSTLLSLLIKRFVCFKGYQWS